MIETKGGIKVKKTKSLLIIMFVLSFILVGYTKKSFSKPFYQGKTIKIQVGANPGGGYDFYARLLARFMPKYLPGSKIIVKNVPGAGHIISVNQIYKAKPDDLIFGTINRGLIFSQLAELKGIKFDLTKLSWLGSATSDIYCLVMSNKFKSIDDVMKADKVKLSSGGLGSQSHVTAFLFMMMKNLNNISISAGYTGSEAELAMMRGEVDGLFASWSSLLGFINSGYGRPVLFISMRQPAGYENVPLIQNIVTEEKYKPAIDLLHSVNSLSRPFAGSPNFPKENLKILQEAFRKVLEDPELLKIVEKADRPIEFTSGEDAEQMIKSMLQLSPELVSLIKKAYGK